MMKKSNDKTYTSVIQEDETNPYDEVADETNEIAETYESLSQYSSQTNLASLEFIREWHANKSLYLTLQITFVLVNLLITLVMLTLSIWITIDKRFKFLSDLGNVSYTSLNRIIGLMPMLSILSYSISLFLDLSQLFLFGYVKKFLNSHTQQRINDILDNQKLVLKLTYDSRHLQLRGRIRRHIKVVLTSLNSLTYMIFVAYLVLVIATQFFIALFIHFNFDVIINYQLPSSLRKLIKEYEKKHIEHLNRMDDLMVIFRYIPTKTLEDSLIDDINVNFQCCNLLNPYQFGDLAPSSCNYQRGCLKPLQSFTWEFLYSTVIVLIVTAALRFCFQLLLWSNFRVLLMRKLINNLYEFDLSKYEFTENEEAELEEKEKRRREKKLKEIREQKERALQEEEEEEERQRLKQEREYQEFLRLERIQDDYERMLERQHRFEELKLEKLKRKLQTEHQVLNLDVVDF